MFHSQLKTTIENRLNDIQALSDERKAVLLPLVDFIQARLSQDKPVALNFICTHNSRRSHLGQIWGKVAAEHFQIPGVTTFSGGTEATAFNPRAVAALERDGFEIKNPGGDNPRYEVSFDAEQPALICFSKTYDDVFNKADDFGAVMTCNHADQNCPAVIGAARISLPYRDPKEADDTPEEASRYSERSAQIATELLFAFSQLKK